MDYSFEMLKLTNNKDEERLTMPIIYPCIYENKLEIEIEKLFEKEHIEKIRLYKKKYIEYYLKYGVENIKERLTINIPDEIIFKLFEKID